MDQSLPDIPLVEFITTWRVKKAKHAVNDLIDELPFKM